jgi:two-component system sensor histidine kinase VicK
VIDTGIGIPNEELLRVFERFYQATNVREEIIRGAGLGLSIARSIVRAHGGTIAAHANEHEGTIIVVRLPLGG